MEEIKVEEYVRTENGLIGKVNKIEPAGSGCRYAGEFLTDEIIQFNDGKIYERRVKRKNIANHKLKLTDLIEVGDIIEVYFPIRKITRKIFVDEYFKDSMVLKGLINGNIILKSILTHEQFEQNSYKV